MRKSRSSWDNLQARLLRELSDAIDSQCSQPATTLTSKYGARPKEDFVRECWPILLESWLKTDIISLQNIASGLRKIGLGDKELSDDFQYLQSCRNAKRLRELVLAEFLRIGKLKSDAHASLDRYPAPVVDTHQEPQPATMVAAAPIKDSTTSKRISTSANQQSSKLLPASAVINREPAPSRGKFKIIAGSIFAVIALGSFSLLWSNYEYQKTIALGEAKHVNKLLNLPEEPGTASASLAQLALFRKSNWRNYLSRRSLVALNKKGNTLHRVLEVDSLRNFALRDSAVPLTEANADQIYDLYWKARRSSAFQYLNPSLQQFVSARTERAGDIKQKVIARQKESERKAKEAAELAAKMKQQEEERQAAATAQAERDRQAAEAAEQARQAAEAQNSGSSGGDNGYQLGPRGGCFYWSGSSKVYVDRSNCY